MSNLKSWIRIPENSDFSIHNLPFGIFSTANKGPRAGVAIGDQILDLSVVAASGFWGDLAIDPGVFDRPYLNDFIGLGKAVTNRVRLSLQASLCDQASPLKELAGAFVDQSAATMQLPVQIGDYTDFYSSIEHATNVGKMFRDPENALLPNWKHIPVGYHGRASSIIPSGVPIRRPMGQVMPNGATQPVFKASARLDFELEMAFIIGKESVLGAPIPIEQAEAYIFGMVLFNDWSARDIQKWEYVPLGPFLGKNFASSMSPWVVTMEALAPFRVEGPVQEPAVLPYLSYQGPKNYDIQLEVGIIPEEKEETIVSQSNFKYMYWNMAQQLAHHTINGCNVRVGDVMASGTISGKEESSYGSMLELAWSGSKPITLNDGTSRVFINDNDTVVLRGFGHKAGIRVGFGEVSTKILPNLKV
ncbi:MAG: fumarylacetoacetase [Saprospiraceae bacterium]